MTRLLVVDDQANVRTTLEIMLSEAGYEVVTAVDGQAALEQIHHDRFDLVLSDLKMGDMTGIDLLRQVKQQSATTEFILMTAYGSVSTAVEAMKLGAHDYLQKPFQESELLVRVERALSRKRMQHQFSAMVSENRERYHLRNLVGRSEPMRGVLGRIVRVAPTDATVLITGESGTGKELVARAIHANSERQSKPFIPVNCAAMTENLIESELFGHVRGAFTGAVSDRRGLLEDANGGTFFFDEVAETSIAFQSKLLRVVQEGEIRRIGDNRNIKVDVRIIAATNQDLSKAIDERRFREDLFYRLNVVRFVLPPLRERVGDIPLLVDFFLARISERTGKDLSLSAPARAFLEAHRFPGNVRELENLLEQGAALALAGEIQLEDISEPAAPGNDRNAVSVGETLQEIVDVAERGAIMAALERVRGNREAAAEILGLSVTTLWRKMKRHDLS